MKDKLNVGGTSGSDPQDQGSSSARLQEENRALRQQIADLKASLQKFKNQGERPGEDGRTSDLLDSPYENEFLYHTVIEQLVEGFALIDQRGVIVEWNRAMEEISNRKRADAIGKFYWDVQYDFILPERRTPERYEYLKKTLLAALEKGDFPIFNQPIVAEIQRSDGEHRIIEQVVFKIQHKMGTRLGCISRDITAQKQAEEALRESEQLYLSLLNVLPEGVALSDLLGTITFASARMAEIYGMENVEEMIGINGLESVAPESREQVRMNMARVGDNEKTEDSEYILLKKDGSRFYGEIKGALLTDSKGRPKGLVSVHRDITERVQRSREMEVIVSTGYALRAASTRAAMLPIVLDQAVNLLSADAGSLELIDPFSEDAVIERIYGVSDQYIGAHIPPDKGLNAYIRATLEPYLTNDAVNDPRILDPLPYKDYCAAAGAPMIAHGQLFGFLWINRKSKINPSEVRLLSVIADIAANAIRRAMLHEQTEQQLEQLTALRKIDNAINSSLSLESKLGVLLEQTLLQLHADAADVLLLDHDRQTLKYAAGQGFRTYAFGHTVLNIGESFAGRVMQDRTPIYISDVSVVDDLHPSFKSGMANEGFLAYCAAPLVAKGSIKGVLEVFQRKPFRYDPHWVNFLETLAGQAAIALDEAQLLQDLQHSNHELQLAYDHTILGWARALDLRDRDTEGHSQRVAELTLHLARRLGMSEADLVHLRRGAILHDIGKMGVPDRILIKPGSLTAEEWDVMKRHPQYAYDMLASIDYMKPALDIPYCHHEKWDGSGYPRGLKGTEIPLAARIFAVVDVWDALISDRPYRKALSEAEALAYLTSQSGRHFDPKIVDLFLEIHEKFLT